MCGGADGAPTEVSVVAVAGLNDPTNLRKGPQPTDWLTQRSDIRTIVITFSEEVVISAATLELVNLADRHDHYPRQLSGGQEQRVAIARAIVTDPKIVVADEPTGDLDKPSAHAIMNLLQRLNKELGMTLIMVTHDPATAEYADLTLHLDKGRLVESPDSAVEAVDAVAVPQEVA